MPFTLMKSSPLPHIAMAEGDEEFRDEDSDSQMGSGADKPLRTDDADKSAQRHPASGRFVPDQTTFGATHGPIAEALAQHRAPAPLASLQTAGTGALAGSITPGTAQVQSLDYRGAMGPLAVNMTPIQPAPHTAPNGPRQ